MSSATVYRHAWALKTLHFALLPTLCSFAYWGTSVVLPCCSLHAARLLIQKNWRNYIWKIGLSTHTQRDRRQTARHERKGRSVLFGAESVTKQKLRQAYSVSPTFCGG